MLDRLLELGDLDGLLSLGNLGCLLNCVLVRVYFARGRGLLLKGLCHRLQVHDVLVVLQFFQPREGLTEISEALVLKPGVLRQLRLQT